MDEAQRVLKMCVRYEERVAILEKALRNAIKGQQCTGVFLGGFKPRTCAERGVEPCYVCVARAALGGEHDE